MLDRLNSGTLGIATLCRALLAVAAVTGYLSGQASAYTSSDPAVLKMIGDSLRVLNSKPAPKYPLDTAFGGGLGEVVFAGYAHLKTRHDDPGNPVVAKAIRTALAIQPQFSGKQPVGHTNYANYVASVSVLLLAEADRVKYRPQLREWAEYFKRAQMSNGAYSYYGEELGDISQTQYAILALWTLDRAGLVIDYDGVVKTIQWLLRVQDPSGGWPYHAKDPGKNIRINQGSRVTPSMAVAGGSSILIAGDILRLWDDGAAMNEELMKKLPKAVAIFKDGMENASVQRPKVPAEPILKAIKDCDVFISKNSVDPAKLEAPWPLYQLYTVERYQSFREIALKLPKNQDTSWYDFGVNFIQSKQIAGGGLDSVVGHSSPSIANSFALLFLIRSTQKAIEAASSGTLGGGQGLPSDTTKIQVKGTQIQGEPVATSVTDLLSVLEGDGANLEEKSLPEDMSLDSNPQIRRSQLDRLERLARGSESWQARRIATRLIGQSDEARVVPTLIFALSDPDLFVRRYARDGLQFISRKFDDMGMPDKPTEEQVRSAQKQWKAWYLTVNPGYVFLDE